MADLLKTFREQGEPAPMYCAHMGEDGACSHEDCPGHVCHLGDLECEAVQEYVRKQAKDFDTDAIEADSYGRDMGDR